jgi:tripartite ATP-independent transporter DctM subunit
MGTILLLSFAILLIIGVPIPFSLGISSLLVLLAGDMNTILVPQRIIVGTDSFSLLAIPFFILSGELMYRGGLSKRLINVANAFIGRFTAGLAYVTTTAATFFAAISGSAPATTAAIGSIMIPEMEKKGYSRDFGAALATAAGPIGQMIPPSIPMVVWAVMANVSITRLFLAGVIPGILMGIALCIVSYVIAKKRNIPKSGAEFSWKATFNALKDGFWALMSPVIVLGGIYGGFFTPTEAAAISVVYGFIVGLFIYKDLKLSEIPAILINSVKTTTMVVFVISVASLFGWIMANNNIAQIIANAILSISTNKIVILLLINVLLLILGCIMDNIAAMVILASVLSYIAAQIGVDPVQFGAIVVINFAVGMITPPIGYSLFVGASVSGLSIEKVSKALWPFLLAEIVVLMLLTYIPAITLYLPNLIMGMN